MNEQDMQLLERFVDGELPHDEVGPVERRIAEEQAWADAHADLLALRSILQDDVAAAVEAADFSNFFAGIEARLPEAAPSAEAAPITARTPEPAASEGAWARVKRWFGDNWVPTLVGAAAAAAVTVWVVGPGADRAGEGSPTEIAGAETPGTVVVDQVDNDGSQTVLISQPAEDEGATVIWLLDEEETDAQPLDGEDPI